MFRIGRQILLGTRHIQHTTQPIRIAPRRCLASRKESVKVYKGAAARLRQSEASDRVRQKRPDVIRFLDEHNQRPAPSGKPRTIITNCPHCLKVRKASFAAYVELDTGKYSCKTCHANGSWSTFTKALKEKLQSSDNYAFYTPSDILKGSSSPAFSHPVQEVENYPHQLQQNAPMLEKLTTQYKLDAETIRKYKVGLADYADPSARLKEATQQGGEGGNQTKSSDQPCYTFPQTTLTYTFSDNGSEATPKEEFREETVRVKACSLDDVNRVVVYDPPNISESRSAGLFGYHLATAEDQAVILTRRELDAMAAYQATGIPSFALPTMYYQLHESVLPLLQRFSKIYIWLDDDLDGQVAAERFAKKLGEARCLLVSTKGGDPEGPKAAHEALMQGKNLKDMLSAARHVKHEQILDFTDLREEVYREIMNPEQTQGVQSTDLPALNKILKGHRPGELTILTGPTGMGKTTVISQLSLDYCKSGVPTLWGSFEIANKRLAKKMLYQFSGKDLSKHPEEFSVWADQFEQLPLYFLKFFSSTPIREVLKACNHAVYAYDVRHIILDNLQFMLSQQGRSSLDRWELQDDAVAELRAFATNHDVHITLVVHPRKDPGDQLDINSVFGSAKVTQEADNVIILQKGDDLGARHLDIKKNRYDGTLGTILYKFEPESLKIKGLSKEEVDAIVERKKKEASSVYSPMRHVQTRR